MSNYTTELRFICESAAGQSSSSGASSVADVIQKAIPKIFDFGFPIFDESYRNVLCTKILMHYYTREISEETTGLWKLRLNTKLNEIMPFYNKLYRSELLEFNPLYDTELETKNNATKKEVSDSTGKDVTESDSTDTTDKTEHRTIGRDTTLNSSTNETGSTTNDDTRSDLYSDTPQGSLTGVSTATYLTNARSISDDKSEKTRNDSSTDTSGTETTTDTFTDDTTITKSDDTTVTRTDNKTVNTTDQYLLKVTGKSGGASYSKMLMEFRETFINIDMMIIKDLATLFFGLW